MGIEQLTNERRVYRVLQELHRKTTSQLCEEVQVLQSVGERERENDRTTVVLVREANSLEKEINFLLNSKHL